MRQEKITLKPLNEQVIVITGASSGIGLATARMAALKGAKVVLSSRNEADLVEIAQDLRKQGCQVLAVPADVSSCSDMEALRDQAMQQFGTIDTWVNNAGVSAYGYLIETPLEEEKQIFETNFWGIRHGSRVAVAAMAQTGGAIINLGSEVSEIAIPQQGMYSASKHAVKAYTDALRMDMEKLNLPIAVTLVRPAGVDTPYTQHARNHLRSGAPSLPAPVYHPDVVARAILRAATCPQRDVYIGSASRAFHILRTFFPRTVDLYMERSMYQAQARGSSIPHLRENEGLMGPPLKEGMVRGGHKGYVMKTSFYTEATQHPVRSLLIAGIGLYAIGRYGKVLLPLARKALPFVQAAAPGAMAAIAPHATALTGGLAGLTGSGAVSSLTSGLTNGMKHVGPAAASVGAAAMKGGSSAGSKIRDIIVPFIGAMGTAAFAQKFRETWADVSHKVSANNAEKYWKAHT
ncbi:MAG: SDR family oxidoreductase [Bdellovibrionota bacterium]